MKTPLTLLFLLVLVATAPASPPPPHTHDHPSPATNAVAQGGSTTNQAAKLTPEQQKQLAELFKQMKQAFDDKKYADAKPLIEQLLKIQPDNPGHWYNLACTQSRLGEKKVALESLETAIVKGWASFHHLERDEDLAPLRKEKGYLAIIARKDEIQKQRAAKINEDLTKQFGAGCLHYIDDDHRLVFATTIDQPTLDELRTTLMAYADALGKELFTQKPERYVSIVIPKNWSDPQIGGFYNDAGALLMAKGFGGTIIHEFIHALHYGDIASHGQDHPIWVKEGLATLFEDSDLVNGQAQPEHNHRLNYILMRAKVNRQVPWTKFMGLKQPDFMRWPNYSYAQARYMFYYLHEKGKLGTWYRNYVETFSADESGAKAWEKTFNKKLPEIEQDWLAWVMTLNELPTRLQEGDATLGLSVMPVNDGLTVAILQANGGAANAGIKVKDVIVRVDDERVNVPQDILKVLNGRRVGDKVRIEYRRGTEYHKIAVELTPAPSPFKTKSQPARKPEPKAAPTPAATPS